MIKVLIVEDDPMVAELNRRYLERIEGFQLAGIVRTGDEALEFIRHKAVDLLLLDVFMPGMNGLELLANIRQEALGLDIILVTAARDKASVQKALRNGVADYLIKPFDFPRFQSALLNYQKRNRMLRSQDEYSQKDLDKQFFLATPAAELQEIPKGLDRNTLKRIWEHILRMSGDFTAEEMAQVVGVSPVSMRKYLKYLQHLELITSDVSYGSVGRPVYRYRRLSGTADPKFSL